MAIKEIILRNVDERRGRGKRPENELFIPSIYIFNEKQFDDIANQLIEYINRNNRHGNQTNTN